MSQTPRRVHRWERGGMDRIPKFLEYWGPRLFIVLSLVSVLGVAALTYLWVWGALLFVPVGAFVVVGVHDVSQHRHTILRNFPILGHVRYFMESIRPEIRQYFVESDQEETPFSREKRTVIYQRAKAVLDTFPFGTRRDVYDEGYEWLAQSLEPTHLPASSARIQIGRTDTPMPYSASLLNVSAMSYGALSRNAILALNEGAKLGGFYHNTGEGGVSSHHLAPGGDLVWQVGTGYFGCRSPEGGFDADKFVETASHPQIKMIEVKLSQGAKPAHGGILPGAKVTAEIASIRGVEIGKTVHSPPMHTAFRGPTGLLEFVSRLRELSGGKPVGFKLCVGQPLEVYAIVKAMVETGMGPDFITVDGAEGGTGAAPIEFSNSVGMPLDDGLNLIHNALVGAGQRDAVRLISAGKIASAFHLVRQLALGADLCNSARAMMFALGCIQALKCNTNHCPAGVATQDPRLMRGLVVSQKSGRVASFHEKTIATVLELCGAAGLASPNELQPRHVFRRTSHAHVRSLEEIYPNVAPGALLRGEAPRHHQAMWDAASADRFTDPPGA